MFQITLDLDTDLAQEVIERSKAKGEDVRSFLVGLVIDALNARHPIKPKLSSPKQRMDDAVDRAFALKPGARFKLQDLYDKDDWATIPSPTNFGRQFKQEVEKANVARYVGKNSANQAIYERLEDSESC